MHKNVVVALLFLFTFISCSAEPKENTTNTPETQEVAQADQMNFQDAPFKLIVKNKNVKVGDVVELIFRTDIEEGLYIYGVITDCVVGPQPPRLEKLELKGMELVGGLYHGMKHKMVADEIFECNYSKFLHGAEIRQKVKITSTDASVSGQLFYQMCSDMLCKSFEFKFDDPGFVVSSAAETPDNSGQNNDSDEKTDDGSKDADEGVDGSKDGDNPDEESASADDKDSTDNEGVAAAGGEQADTAAKKKSFGAASGEDAKKKSLWGLFLLGLGGGLIALFTPCVYPMIPMTVAFFTKETDKSKGRKKAMVYGLSILIVYIVAGVTLAAIFGETFAYTLSTHWFPNILFFIVFIIFALAFLGMFELTLPSGFVNKMDSRGGKGGYIGVFFIALTLVVVSFSCTAPIVGTVAILSADGDIIKAVAAMTGFALAFALPFTLFAFFPSWLNNLPQSGGWLNSVKVVLGFLELALAFKFLSQADLAYQWGILDRHIFLAIWVALSFLLGLYLLGKIKFPHDSDLDRIPVPRFILAATAFVFTVYLLPGMWGAPLKPLSGFLPPMTTQDFVLVSGEGGLSHAGNDSAANGKKEDVMFSDVLKSEIHGKPTYFDYTQALNKSKELKKPLFIDFTGHTCANCRKMEIAVLSDPRIKQRLEEEFVVVSLYVDDHNLYPKDQWYKNKDGVELKEMGEINLDRQINQFNQNGQPFYFVLDWDENVYVEWGGYENNRDKFVEFLDLGKKGVEDWAAAQ